ncbi:MAG: c-type cytochrome, partial [Planctomycetales bacterium]|nr:c-type cytochrome [Planctomycetales bacterium]
GLICRNCHRVEGQGEGAVGPDLAGLGAKYAPAELLDAILNPSARINDPYITTAVQTNDGRSFLGVVTSRDDQRLRMRDAENHVVELAAADIELVTSQPTSLMPEFLLRGLTPQQAADLLAFLVSLKTPPAAEPASSP